MASRERRPSGVAAGHNGSGDHLGATSTGRGAESSKQDVDEAARRAEEYLASAAELAKDYLSESTLAATTTDEDKLARAAELAAELLVTAEATAVELLGTAQQVAVEKLASAHRFEAMFRDHGAMMLLIDPVTWQIVDVNPAAAEFYGYPVNVLRSMSFTQINTMPPGDVATLVTQAGTREHGHVVLSHRLADGEIRRVDVYCSPISDGRPLLFAIIVDIENRVRDEEALARSENLYRMLSGNADGAVLLVSTTGAVIWASPSIERLLGYTPAEAMAMDGAALVHPDDLEAARAAVPRGSVPAGGVQLRFRHKDGQYRWMASTSRPVTDPDGTVTGRIDALRDIHDEVLAVQALAVSEAESRLAFDLSRVATCLVSNDGRLVRVNTAMCDLLGRGEAELLTLTFLEVTHPDDATAGADLLRDLLDGRRPSLRLTKRYVTGNGRVVWGDATVTAVCDASGAVLHRVAQILDVTAEHALRESLVEAQRIAHIGSWQVEVATGAVVWSPELYAMFGMDPASPVPDYTDHSALFTPSSWQELNAALEVTQETGLPYELELEMVRLDGTRGWMLARGEALRDADGAIVGITGVAMDVTEHKTASDALAAQTQRLELVLKSSRLGVWDWNMITGEVVFDERWAEIVGYRLAELQPVSIETWQGLSHPSDLAGSNASIEEHIRGLSPSYDIECRMRHRDGHWVWVRDRGEIVEWTPDGRPSRMTGTHEDITERHLADMDMRASHAKLEQAQRIAHIGSWQVDVATGAVLWSPELYAVFGMDPTSPVPDYTDQSALFTPSSWQELNAALEVTQETGLPYELELEMVRLDGTRGWMLARGEALRDADGAIVGLTGVAMDVTERKTASDALRVLATHDPLTGLANRVALLDEITRAVSSGRRSRQSTAVLMMDLDRFKNVNDTLGHTAGDDLLVAAAARIETVVRAGDLVARLGGDEFVVVMRDLGDPAEAVRAGDRLVDAFRAPFTTAESELYATASVGVAIATGTGDAGDLLQEADTAMYAAKRAGRDRVWVFNEDLRATVTKRLSVENDLRQALARGQLAVWFQPEVNLATGKVVAVEALLRWHHPDGTVWSADRFIDVAEDTGLIMDIGDWVLRQACGHGAVWAVSRPHAPITVRVNVSALQLAETGLLPTLDEALMTSGLDPTLLCVEITETALLRQTTTAASNLDGIHRRGIGIAIDDFGTGYASLTYLAKYPVDVLKIDRSFITDPSDPGHDHSLVAGIIVLATGLGISVTAEGVEHVDQAAHLRQMGCPTAQGFLYSQAQPPERMTPLLDHIYPHP